MPYMGRSNTGFGIRDRFQFTASGSETSISGSDDNGRTLKFSDGKYVDVYLNGVYLDSANDYNTSTTNTIGGLTALTASDYMEIVSYDIFSVADVVPATGGTFSGNVTAASNFTVTGNHTVTGDLTVTGDDITMGTNTSGAALIADGTNFNPVVISGDATIATNGALTIASTAIESGMLNANIISGQTEITSVDGTNDDILILDATDGALKKVALTNMGFITDDPTALAIALG